MLIGKRISGRYNVLETIGGGGMANVYLAHDIILDRDVAVKVLRLDFANDEEFIRRFRREAKSATSLNHPNIVNIYDIGEEGDIYYIVMEFVDGQTLKQYIQQYSPLPVEEAIHIMKQLTSAISHAHQNNIVHRDIKPQNILVDRSGNIKITDFGIAMALSATSITQTNSVLGSVHYLSPEQARGAMANRKSDIYSLGIVMFELLTGRLPFFGESAVSIALKHLQTETPSVRRWNPTIPQSVENIVLQATTKDPFDRYESVEKMEEDLSTALNPERLTEEKFHIPEDDEATKAIPIITNDNQFGNLDETIVHPHSDNQTKPTTNSNNTTKKKKRKKWPIILTSIFVSLLLLLIFFVTVVPNMLKPKDIPVPDVTNLEISEAIAKLEENGFHIGETLEVVDNEVEVDHIVKTDPKAGHKAKEGSDVNLYVSTGKEKFQLSDYRDRQYDDVYRLLENKNFKDIVKNEVHDESEPGTILEQDPAPEEEVIPEETVLQFTVSKGPEKIVLKDLIGLNAKGITDYAESVGLHIDMSKEEHHESIQSGLVISQSPVAGTALHKGDKVTVIISKGKKEIPPKSVFKEIIIPYEPAEEGEPQEVQIYIEDMNRSMTEPFDTFYITETTKRRLEFTIAEGKKAGYKVMRDRSVIIDETIPFPQ